MQVTQPGGQLWNQAMQMTSPNDKIWNQFGTNQNACIQKKYKPVVTILQLMQIATSGGQICN